MKHPTAPGGGERGETGPGGLTDALGPAVLYDVFVTLATEALVASVRVDAVTSAMAARF